MHCTKNVMCVSAATIQLYIRHFFEHQPCAVHMADAQNIVHHDNTKCHATFWPTPCNAVQYHAIACSKVGICYWAAVCIINTLDLVHELAQIPV